MEILSHMLEVVELRTRNELIENIPAYANKVIHNRASTLLAGRRLENLGVTDEDPGLPSISDHAQAVIDERFVRWLLRQVEQPGRLTPRELEVFKMRLLD